MSSSTPEASSSESETSGQILPQRGTTLASQRGGAFEPPLGSVLIGGPDDDAGETEAGEFDWDSVRDDEDIELWLIRVPNSVRSFVNLSLSLLFFHPSAGLVAGSGPVLGPSRGGVFEQKKKSTLIGFVSFRTFQSKNLSHPQ